MSNRQSEKYSAITPYTAQSLGMLFTGILLTPLIGTGNLGLASVGFYGIVGCFGGYLGARLRHNQVPPDKKSLRATVATARRYMYVPACIAYAIAVTLLILTRYVLMTGASMLLALMTLYSFHRIIKRGFR
jgi:hypothetical protein